MILVDTRIGSRELQPLIRAQAELAELDYGDFCWVGHGDERYVSVGVERKKLHDLINSIQSGRLSGHQLIGMMQMYDYIYLVVEGVWRPNYRTGIVMTPRGKRWVQLSKGKRIFGAKDIYNYLNSLSVMCNVRVMFTDSKWVTARWLDACYSWWQKPWLAHKSHMQFSKPSKVAHLTKPNLVARVASQITGVGWDKARKLGERFASVVDFMGASEDDLREIEGIGKVLAQSIRKQIGG